MHPKISNMQRKLQIIIFFVFMCIISLLALYTCLMTCTIFSLQEKKYNFHKKVHWNCSSYICGIKCTIRLSMDLTTKPNSQNVFRNQHTWWNNCSDPDFKTNNKTILICPKTCCMTIKHQFFTKLELLLWLYRQFPLQ